MLFRDAAAAILIYIYIYTRAHYVFAFIICPRGAIYSFVFVHYF